MIVSHRNRFVFVKTRKTAGSSLEIALSRLCDAGDVVTPLSEELGEETLREQEGGQPPVNWRKPLWRYTRPREWRRLLRYGERAPILPQHATAPALRAWLGRELWETYFRFTVERNPWDRALSRYWWQRFRMERRGRSIAGLSEYLRWLEREKPYMLSNWGHYTIDDRIAVDKVIFFEDLEAGLSEVAEQLGLSAPIRLPSSRAKSGFRKDRAHYSEILGARDRALIDRVCAREIEAFGYRF